MQELKKKKLYVLSDFFPPYFLPILKSRNHKSSYGLKEKGKRTGLVRSVRVPFGGY